MTLHTGKLGVEYKDDKMCIRDREKEERNKLFHKVTLDNLFDSIQQGEMKELNIIVKADVQGSVEAVRSSLEKLTNDCLLYTSFPLRYLVTPSPRSVSPSRAAASSPSTACS